MATGLGYVFQPMTPTRLPLPIPSAARVSPSGEVELDPRRPSDVGDLVGLGDHGRDAVSNQRFGESRGRQQGSLRVYVSIEEAGEDIRPGSVDHPAPGLAVFAHTCYQASTYRYVGRVELTGERGEHRSALEQQARRLLAERYSSAFIS